MTQYRIVCTDQSDPPAYGHGHILGVGLTDAKAGPASDKATMKETVKEVRENILYHRNEYYTYSASTGKWATVATFDCSCGVRTIRSGPDAVMDNNLDRLRLCSWT